MTPFARSATNGALAWGTTIHRRVGKRSSRAASFPWRWLGFVLGASDGSLSARYPTTLRERTINYTRVIQRDRCYPPDEQDL
jgi:hypothetical protein